MKKLFISQPMKGKTDEAIKEERQQAIREAEQAVGEPVEVIDSFFEGAPADAKPLWFWENRWNCSHRQTLHISPRDGRMRGDVGLNILVHRNMTSVW